MTPRQTNDRLVGIDLFRIVAFVGVVLIHTATVKDEDRISGGGIIVGLCHFAVPYFFMAAGYFLRDDGFIGAVGHIIRRVIPIFLLWGIFYCLLFEGSLEILSHPKALARFFYTGLPAYHLWFLPALIAAVVIFSAARARLTWPGIFLTAALFYLAGLLLGPWHELVGLSAPPFGTRNGPWFSLMFVALGAWWRACAPRNLSPVWAATIVFFAAIAQLGENWVLLNAGAVQSISGSDVTLMTLPFGIAVFALAQAWKAGRISMWLAGAGTAAFGMYLVHAAFVMLAQRFVPPTSLAARLTDAGIAVVASIAVALLMIRTPILKRLIR